MLSASPDWMTDDPLPEDLAAQRRIDAGQRAIESRGLKPATNDPYFGLVPRNSPAGEVIGEGVGAVEDAGRFAGEAVKNLSHAGLPDWLMKGAEFAKWSLKPRGAHRTAAFTQAGANPHAYDGTPKSPIPLSTPSPGQAADRLSAALGMDASGAVSSAKPPRGRAIDYDPETASAGTIGFSFGKGPLKVYDPGKTNIRGGDFGDSSKAAASGGAASQTDINKIPVGQRPASFMGDFADQRAIEGAAPAPGPLGKYGLSVDEAKKYYGERWANEGLTDRAVAVENARQAGPRQTRESYQRELDQINQNHQQALQMAKAIPDEKMRKAKVAEVEKRGQDNVAALNTKYGLSERLSSNAIYNPPLQ